LVHKILVGVDESENSEKLIRHARDIQKKFDCELVVYHSIGQQDYLISNPSISPNYILPLYYDFQERDIIRSREILNRAKTIIGEDDPKVETRLVTGSTADDYAINACKEEDFDLVIIGQKRDHRIWDHLFGSVSQNILNRAECDVMVIK